MKFFFRVLRAHVLTIFLAGSLLGQGSVLLVGGGSEDYADWSDEPYQWLVNHAPNKSILVLHYSDGSTWLESYFRSFGALSAASLVIPTKAAANDSSVYRTILAADGLFLRGGDQWQYVNLWKGTLAEQAIREVFQRGGAVGGTSAGEAILSEIVFDAQYTSLDPRASLRNPLGSSITLTDDFLRLCPNLLADSHFFARGRLGRLGPMLSFYKSSKGRAVVGLGIDENTAVAIGSDGFGEVMGSGTATLLRYASDTRDTVESSNPFSVYNMKLDQLTTGFSYSILTGEIRRPQSATVFSPKSISASSPLIILDGSNSMRDWSTSTGSIKKLQGALSLATDTVGIFSSPASTSAAISVDSTFRSWGMLTKILWIDEARKNDVTFSRSISACSGFVFAGNSPDSLGQLLSDSTSAGKSFKGRATGCKAILFLSDDVMMAGETGVSQMYKSIYGAYYGYLTLVKGIGTLKGLEFVPRIYENTDYVDNRMSALFWMMAKANLPVGIMLDVGSHAVVQSNRLFFFGATPAMVVDARSAQWVGYPTWRDPGKANPRQNAAIVGARFHVLRNGSELDLGASTGVGSGSRGDFLPANAELAPTYPNPFNPGTVISYRLSAISRISLKVYDLLGREVALLADGVRPAGISALRFDGSNLPSGIYISWLVVEPLSSGQGEVRTFSRKMVLLK